MFGGWKFNKNSELFRESEGNTSNEDKAVSSVNDGLFQKIHDAQQHAKQIMQTGQAQYIDGIKQNVLDRIHLWLEAEGSHVFTLYGKMGCGKSFFSARLYSSMEQEKERYDTVAFSSQQLYRDTTQLRNMLLSLAHQLFLTVPVCSAFFSNHPLDSDSIPMLTENGLIAPFDRQAPEKTVLIIIDGLDEYSRADCEAFLETLGRLRARLSPKVKIFFTSRPEDYIISEMICSSEDCAYYIERNEDQSHEDCARFIDAKCRNAQLELPDRLKQQLIQKSECSLKYLECFFNEVTQKKISVTADFIDNLPIGLTYYYRDQLVRYFGDESLRFYQDRIVPLLELLCVVWQPITIAEAADILSCRERDIQDIINRSGTLLWRKNRFVMLYQSESIREFLIDDRCCPEKYRIDRDNGHRRVLDRLQGMLDNAEEPESNMYLFQCGVEHILSQERIAPAQWALLIRIATSYADKSDMVFKLCQRLLDRSVAEIIGFLRQLYTDPRQEPLLRDYTCVRLLAVAVTEQKTDKLLAALERLEGPELFDFPVNYCRARVHRVNQKYLDAKSILERYTIRSSDDDLSICRHSFYMDELCRVYRNLNCIGYEENTDLHLLVLQETEQVTQKCLQVGGPLVILQQRSLSVSYGQTAALCLQLERQTDIGLRQRCAYKLQQALRMPAQDASRQGFFLQMADIYQQKGLQLAKFCQQSDADSDSRIYDMHFAFSFLGELYFRKDFPGYNPDKALQYFEECLAGIMEIAQKSNAHVRFIQVATKLYDKLMRLYLEQGAFASAKQYLAEAARTRQLRALYHPGSTADFNCCYSCEQEADIVKAESGIAEAEPLYLAAVEQYLKCAQKYTERKIVRAPMVVYYKLAKAFREAGDLLNFIKYTRLEMQEQEKLYSHFPSNTVRWDMGVCREQLANALFKTDPKGTVAQRLEALEEAFSIFLELAQAAPDNEKYRFANCSLIYDLQQVHLQLGQNDEAVQDWENSLAMGRDILQNGPNSLHYLYIPILLCLQLAEQVPDLPQLSHCFEATAEYIPSASALTQDEIFHKAVFYFREKEGKHVLKTKGLAAAESIILEYIRQGREFVQKTPSESYLWSVVGSYILLGQEHNKKSHQQAIHYYQEGLQAAEEYLKSAPNSVILKKAKAYIYGLMAETLKDYSNASHLNTATELYILSLQHYFLIFRDAEDEAQKASAKQLFIAACGNLHNFLKGQEQLVKAAQKFGNAQKTVLTEYVQRLVKGYEMLAVARVEGAEEKKETYTALLKELTETGE